MTTPTPLAGQVHLVTGATSGIGKAAAGALARLGATVLLVGRDPARGEATLAAIRQAQPAPAVELFLADLSSQASVRALARSVRSRHDRLHVLLNNAAVVPAKRRLTVDGIEETFAVNHLAPFLLTKLLTEPLLAAGRGPGGARVVTVSSEAHRMGPMRWDDLQGERGFRGFRAYAQSKLANVLFTRELARRLANTGVTANSLHPGVVNTGVWREASGFLGLLTALGKLFMISPERGADPVVHLAAAPELAGRTGLYFNRHREVPAASAALDDAAATRLWEISEVMAPSEVGSSSSAAV